MTCECRSEGAPAGGAVTGVRPVVDEDAFIRDGAAAAWAFATRDADGNPFVDSLRWACDCVTMGSGLPFTAVEGKLGWEDASGGVPAAADCT